MSNKLLVKLLDSQIQPILNYGCKAWYNGQAHTKLEILQAIYIWKMLSELSRRHLTLVWVERQGGVRWLWRKGSWSIVTALKWNHLPLCSIYALLKWLNTGSCKCLPPVRGQAITWTNMVLLSLRSLGINFSEIWIEIQNFPFMEMHSTCRLRDGGHLFQWKMS